MELPIDPPRAVRRRSAARILPQSLATPTSGCTPAYLFGMSTPRRLPFSGGVRAAAVLLLLCACAPRVRADDPPPAPAPAPPAAPAPAAPPKAEVAVKLLEPGAEPRALLRLKAPKGAREKAQMSMSVKTKAEGVDAGGQEIGLEFTTEVKDVFPDGDREYEIVLGKMSLHMGAGAEGTQALIDGMLESVQGTRVVARVTERGRQKDVKVTMPDGVEPMVSETMKQSMEQMNELGVRFLPEEPVGPGARWEVKDHPDQDGIVLDQTIVFTLKSREKERLLLELAIVQSGAPQTIKSEDMPGGELELVALTSKGTGTMDYDLTRLLPTKAKITLDMTTEMRSPAVPGVEAQAAKVAVALEVTISGEPAPAAAPAPADPK